MLDSGIEYLIWLLLTPCIFWLASRFNFERGAWTRHLGIHVMAAIAIPCIIQAYSHYAFITFNWNSSRPPTTVLESLLAFRFFDELIIYLFVVATGFARNYFLRYRKNLVETVYLRTEAARLQTQLAEARLQALRMQINPHFLFNTLNAVSILVERDPKKVRRMISLLSDLLRYTLEDENVREVPLHQELQFLRSYFQIQQIRFEGRLDVNEQIEDLVQNALLPSLILQPLAENAIKHGVSRVVGKGIIELRAGRNEDALLITIRDNGPGLITENGAGSPTYSEGIGLRNIRERLSELYGKDAYLVLESAEGGGMMATISLPYHTQYDLATVAF